MPRSQITCVHCGKTASKFVIDRHVLKRPCRREAAKKRLLAQDLDPVAFLDTHNAQRDGHSALCTFLQYLKSVVVRQRRDEVDAACLRNGVPYVTLGDCELMEQDEAAMRKYLLKGWSRLSLMQKVLRCVALSLTMTASFARSLVGITLPPSEKDKAVLVERWVDSWAAKEPVSNTHILSCMSKSLAGASSMSEARERAKKLLATVCLVTERVHEQSFHAGDGLSALLAKCAGPHIPADGYTQRSLGDLFVLMDLACHTEYASFVFTPFRSGTANGLEKLFDISSDVFLANRHLAELKLDDLLKWVNSSWTSVKPRLARPGISKADLAEHLCTWQRCGFGPMVKDIRAIQKGAL